MGSVTAIYFSAGHWHDYVTGIVVSTASTGQWQVHTSCQRWSPLMHIGSSFTLCSINLTTGTVQISPWRSDVHMLQVFAIWLVRTEHREAKRKKKPWGWLNSAQTAFVSVWHWSSRSLSLILRSIKYDEGKRRGKTMMMHRDLRLWVV